MLNAQAPKGIPASITREQFEEYRRLTLEAIKALGVDPNLVALNGVRTRSLDGEVSVEFIVPAPGWDGDGVVPAQPDPWRENELLKGERVLRILPR